MPKTTSSQLFLVAGVFPALFLQLLGAFFYFVILDDSPWAQPVYGIVKLTIVLFLLVWILKKPPLPSMIFRWKWNDSAKGLLWGILCAISIVGAAWLAQTTLFSALPAIQQKMTAFPILQNHFWSAAILFSLAHSLFEEWYWRHFVGRGLELYLHPSLALTLGSLAFTAHHIIILGYLFPWWFTIIGSISIFLGGAIWSLLYKKTDNLLTPWISHILADLAIFVVLFFSPVTNQEPCDTPLHHSIHTHSTSLPFEDTQ